MADLRIPLEVRLRMLSDGVGQLQVLVGDLKRRVIPEECDRALVPSLLFRRCDELFRACSELVVVGDDAMVDPEKLGAVVAWPGTERDYFNESDDD
jgi:hypothetical protein